MTKAEQRKILEQIDALIKSADADSYIADTFAGIVNICRSNIDNDFADYPVQDLEFERERFSAEVRRHDETKRQLADVQNLCAKVIEERDTLLVKLKETKKERDSWEQNAHDAGDLYCELEEECRAKSQEITKLRAEIVRMKFERMTEFDLATMYEKM